MAELAANGGPQRVEIPEIGEKTSGAEDPFVTNDSASHNPHPHRYSSFDTMSMSMNSTSSPSQVKRTLETHLAETERRLQEASKLGTSLVQQRQELTAKLQEVERQQDEAEISPELRDRLAALEKEYNEVGRESAGAILAPKSRVVSLEERQSTSSPVKYESLASGSPTKLSVPSRKHRNQQSSRVGDIQFAADISTSLLAQVRQLQGLLAEREDALKSTNLEKSRLELEAEGFNQRLRVLDESEQRYKDENWNLDTQVHELSAAVKEAEDREKKLNANLSAALNEKTKAYYELDDLKISNGKLSDEHAAAKKAHDSELHAMRRNLDVGDTERSSLQKKIDDLTSQNQELAKFAAARFRQDQIDSEKDLSFLDDELSKDLSTPDHSPPPSPSKTPRHGTLDSETLKNSLHHAHRMIQNLKNNIHREKTDKMELKRMLQDARDELETRRGDGTNGVAKRQKSRSELFKKLPRSDMLGAGRRSRTDFELEEAEWEDHNDHDSPSRKATATQPASNSHNTDLSDVYQTANESDAFETANEKDTTESEAFETGAESLAGDSTDELTETESRPKQGGTQRSKKPSSLGLRKPGDRSSYISTASTSTDEDEIKTPIQSYPQKYQLKMKRGLLSGRSRGSIDADSSPAGTKDSPASYLSNRSTPAPEGNSLFAELGELNGVGSDGDYSTPARSSILSGKSTPAIASASRKSTPPTIPDMVDSSTMTEPWESLTEAKTDESDDLRTSDRSSMTPLPSDFPLPPSHPSSPYVLDANSQFTPQKSVQESPLRHMSSFITPPKTIWDEQQAQESVQKPVDTPSQKLNVSDVTTVHTGPELREHESLGAGLPSQTSQLGMSNVLHVDTQPQIREKSRLYLDATAEVPQMLTPLSISKLTSQQTVPDYFEPRSIPKMIPHEPLTFSPLSSQDVAPIAASVNRPTTGKAGSAVGILGSFGAALGLAKARDNEASSTPKDPVSTPQLSRDGANRQTMEASQDIDKAQASCDCKDQGSQTILSSDQIDQALMQKSSVTSATSTQKNTLPALATAPTSLPPPGIAPRLSSRSLLRSIDDNSDGTLPFPTKRPGSATSQRASALSSHPPLPVDHKLAIATATTKVPASPGKGVMGPPITPASAYRRPQTPRERSMPSPTRDGTTPRARTRQNSQISRRSSVSSFASELDERFHIRADVLPNGQVFEPGTDPRMIQAITQTMIGEFLWKYTRKAGRGEMSSTRHRRYFWVHPYTRTLYWSDQDPQSATKSELKAKSVPIEAVRVVSDENPLPPGLHRKSIEIVTPGRRVKFTASTGQRHDTWLNALSYLLLRSQEGPQNIEPTNITNEDLAEFNPQSGNRYSASRASLSSYNSRATQNTTIRANSRLSLKQPTTPGTTTSRHASAPEVPAQDSLAHRSISRISNYFRPGTVTKGSIASRKGTARSRHLSVGTADGSIYNASVVNDGGRDSQEEIRKEMLRAERESHRVEDVRACCDGSFWN